MSFIHNFLRNYRLNSKNPAMRLKAIVSLPESEEAVLQNYAATDPSTQIRAAAIEKINDIAILEKLLWEESDAGLIDALRCRLKTQCFEKVKNSTSPAACKKDFERIADEKLYHELALSAPAAVAVEAAAMLSAPALIIKVLNATKEKNVINRLLEKLGGNKYLLEMVIQRALTSEIRDAAMAKLAKLASASPPAPEVTEAVQEKTLYQKIKPLLDEKENFCVSIENAALSADVSSMISPVEEIKTSWRGHPSVPKRFQELLDKRFAAACIRFDNAVKEYHLREESKAENAGKLEDLYVQLIRISNAGLDLVKMKELEKIGKSWNEYVDKAGDVTELKERFNGKFVALEEKIKAERAAAHHAAAILEENCRNLENLISAPDFWNNRHRFDELKKTVKELKTDNTAGILWRKWKDLSDKFSVMLHEEYRARDFQRWENYTLKQDICNRLEKLLLRNDLREVSVELKEIRNRWKDVGPVPNEKNEEIWLRYKNASDILYNRCREYFAKLKQEEVDNFQSKLKLCETVEVLKDSLDWKKTAEEIKQYQAQWKEITSAGKEDNALYLRFRSACNYFFSARDNHFKQRQEDTQKNAKTKERLCVAAEALTALPVREAVVQCRRLREDWHKTTFAGRSEHQLRERFDAAINKFFAGLDKNKLENLQRKENLLAEMKNLINAPDAGGVILRKEYVRLEKEWHAVGPVPHEKNEDINSRFNVLFNQLKKLIKDCELKSIEADIEKVLHLEEHIQLLAELASNADPDYNAKNKLEEIVAWWTAAEKPSDAAALTALERIFRQACEAFTGKNRHFFRGLKDAEAGNLKKKLKICMYLEALAGISGTIEEDSGRPSFSLADELNLAIQNNFASESYGDDVPPEKKIKELREEWCLSGMVPSTDSAWLYKRFLRACNAAASKVNQLN